MWSKGHRPVLILSIAQALYLSSLSVIFTFSGLVGASLASSPGLATLPLALSTVLTALATIPLSMLTTRIGRRATFQLGALAGAAGAGLAAAGAATHDFGLFCLGNALIGIYQASAMFYRLAAADLAAPEFRARAVSWVLAGGVAAALIGPEIAAQTRASGMGAAFAGAYVAAGLLALASVVALGGLRVPPQPVVTMAGATGRSLRAVIRQPVFLAAAINTSAAYIVMSFVMTASPLAVVAAGHGTDAAAGITRWHLLGMFAPSFFTGALIARFGVLPILAVGTLLLLMSAIIALGGSALPLFNLGLLVLGVGWNFMFIGGTALLTEAYLPSERAKTQAVNEFLVFGTSALATLAAGAVQSALGWKLVNIVALPMLVIAGFATIGLAVHRRRQPGG